jgi:hypothetical protein
MNSNKLFSAVKSIEFNIISLLCCQQVSANLDILAFQDFIPLEPYSIIFFNRKNYVNMIQRVPSRNLVANVSS